MYKEAFRGQRAVIGCCGDKQSVYMVIYAVKGKELLFIVYLLDYLCVVRYAYKISESYNCPNNARHRLASFIYISAKDYWQISK